jgi:hypothetical protein
MDQTVEDVVTAAQIQALPVLEGYLSLAGDLPVAKLKVSAQQLEETSAAFLDVD